MARSAQAYEEFSVAAREHERDLYTRALRLTHNPAEARDLTQRALERGLRSLHQFAPGTNIRVWLLRILVNLFLDDCRRAARGPKLESLDATPGRQLPSAVVEEPEEEPPWARITSEQFNQAMHSLSPLFRQIYELRVRDNLRYHEIAARLDIPPGTVATRLARARRRLYELLAPMAAGPEQQ
ncbi:MAG TPA: sigma-70 family RNA polymerase sigma factor [Polyangia bacterium]